ncbi:Flp pilus assembly complex ATPase component TadA [Candidatus Woesearchaeota archaeon]|nr:Flp pilus assembly complex ATPase component TadA [Candidatus Woesearchaeota archaeon]
MGLLEKAKKGKPTAKIKPKKEIPETTAKKGSIQTIVDNLLESVKKRKNTAKFSEIARDLEIDPKTVERLAKKLSEHGVVKIIYPINVLQEPSVSIGKEEKFVEKRPLPKDKKLLESYEVTADFVKAKVNIWSSQEKDVPVYEIIMPGLEPATRALLDSLMNSLAQKIPIAVEDITDPRKIIELKEVFFEKALQSIKAELPKSEESQVKMLAGTLLHKMYGLGEMEVVLSDNLLEEVAINGANQPISLYHKKYGWLESTEYPKGEEDIYNFASQIGRKVNREITSLNPIMDAHLLTGDRVAATLFPISTSGNTITIRRFARNPWTIVHFIDPKINCFSKEIAAFLWMAMQYELNIMVAGGTASGKTSVLNAVTSLIPATQRIISIEDTREITLPDSLLRNWIPLTSRNPNPEGKGEVSMLDLLVASLRMRPDRVIVGEVRRRQQAEAMFEAMHTGHAVYCTMHADTIAQVLRRLVEPPIKIPRSEVEALHLILVQYRDRRRGLRRTLELAEVLSGGEKLDVNYLYRWLPRNDSFEKTNDSVRITEELNLHTGMTPKEISRDLKEKQLILEWMLKNNIKDVNPVGQVMRVYYKTPDIIINAAKKNKKLKEILK